MKFLMNSKVEEELQRFFKEQRQYEDDSNKPDLDVINASSLEDEMKRIVKQIQMDSRIEADFETTEDMYHESIYGINRSNQTFSSQTSLNYNDSSSEYDTRNPKKDPFHRIVKKTTN